MAKWLNDRSIKHLRGAPYHPMTQGKIERWRQTLKNRILLENYFLPGDLEAQIAAFIDDYIVQSKAQLPRRGDCSCMSSEHFGQLAWQFERMSGSSGLKVQAVIAC